MGQAGPRRRPQPPIAYSQPRETVWKVGGGFLIACVSCFKRTRWDIFALFWLLAILQIEAYWDFPDCLSRNCLINQDGSQTRLPEPTKAGEEPSSLAVSATKRSRLRPLRLFIRQFLHALR